MHYIVDIILFVQKSNNNLFLFDGVSPLILNDTLIELKSQYNLLISKL